jgi:hypothetical protein
MPGEGKEPMPSHMTSKLVCLNFFSYPLPLMNRTPYYLGLYHFIRWESMVWRWIWRVGPRLVGAFQHLSERYRSVRDDRNVSSTPIVRPNIELVELPRVAVPLSVDPPSKGTRPRRQSPAIPASTTSKLPPLPSRSAGPNTTSSVWDDSELGE